MTNLQVKDFIHKLVSDYVLIYNKLVVFRSGNVYNSKFDNFFIRYISSSNGVIKICIDRRER